MRPRGSCSDWSVHFADRTGIEAQVGEPAVPRNLAQLHVVWRVDIDELRMEFVEGLLQRGALAGLDLAPANTRGRKAGDSAEQDRPDEGQRQDETKSRYGCLLGPFGQGSGLGPVQPTCRPPLSGRTDHHTQRALPKNADS